MFCLFEVVWFVHGAKQQASRTMNGELGPFCWWLHVCWGQQSFIVLFVCCCCLLLFSELIQVFVKVFVVLLLWAGGHRPAKWWRLHLLSNFNSVF